VLNERLPDRVPRIADVRHHCRDRESTFIELHGFFDIFGRDGLATK
jgi:hypothetical protein